MTPQAKSYQAYRLERTLFVTRLSCFLAAIAAAVYYPMDASMLGGPAAEFLQRFRLMYMVPVPLLWALATWVPRLRDRIFSIMLITGVPIGWSFSIACIVGGDDAVQYTSHGLTQLCLFAAFLLGLPPVKAAIALLLMNVPFMLLVLDSGVSEMQRFVSLSGPFFVSVLGVAVAARTEYRERIAFRRDRELSNLRERVERNRNRQLAWLQTFSQFIRHECKNALAGIHSSLQLLGRSVSLTADQGAYVDRARRSLDYISSLLAKAAEATSLESALFDESYTPTNLQEIAKRLVLDYQSRCKNLSFTFTDDSSSPVFGNGQRFEQLLEKLLTNATEHCDPRYPICVDIVENGNGVGVSVSNRGAELPDDVEALFELFNSRRKGSDNLGLGLYVARTIATHFGGTLTASPLQNPPGVRFDVVLPRSRGLATSTIPRQA